MSGVNSDQFIEKNKQCTIQTVYIPERNDYEEKRKEKIQAEEIVIENAIQVEHTNQSDNQVPKKNNVGKRKKNKKKKIRKK